MTKFIALLGLYVGASVLSQFLTSTPIELFVLFGVAIWMPLSSLTVVPLVDVLRSFTQHAAEKCNLSFKLVGSLMLGLTMGISGFCVMFANLPVQIFAAVLAAVTIGGALDILVFRKMGELFTSPVKRMAVSNAVATLVGSGIVFLVAFTSVFFPENPLARPDFEVVVGWLTQSVFIWIASLIIALGMGKVVK